MKKLFILFAICCVCLCGCGKKEKLNDDSNNDNLDIPIVDEPNNEPEVEIPEINDKIIADLNQKLLNSGSELQFEYDGIKFDKETTYYVYITQDEMQVRIELDNSNKLKSLSVYAPPSQTISGNYDITEDYIRTKLFLLKLEILDLTQEDFSDLAECLTGLKTGFCPTTSHNFMAASEHESSSFHPTFSLLISKDIQ